LGFLEEFIDDHGYAIGASLSQADGAFVRPRRPGLDRRDSYGAT
jgi:hypothetical protein